MFENLRGSLTNYFSKVTGNPDEQGADDAVQSTAAVELVTKAFTECQKKRRMVELQMLLNTAFLDGNQHVDINGVTMTIEEAPKKYDYEVREVYNEIAPIYDTRLAKLGRVKPMLRARPATSEPNDINTAKVCTAIVRGTSVDVNMSERIDEANAWSELCGTAFYKQVWDKEGGRKIGTDENGQPIFEGKPETVVVSPFEIFPDSLFTDRIKDQRFIIHAKPMHIDEIEALYGKRVEGKEINVFSLSTSDIGVGGLGYNSQQTRMRIAKEKKHEIVKEYWENPSKDYPEGRLLIVAGDVLLYQADKLPYRCGKDGVPSIPLVKQVAIKAAGRFFGKSVIERIIPVQRQYNNVINRSSEYLNRSSVGILVVEEGSIANMEDIEEFGFEPGMTVIKRKGFEAPKFLDYANLPTEFSREREWCIQEFIRISGVSEISRDSNIPAGTGSGVALNILKEQDDTRMSLPAESVRKAVMQVGEQWLRFLKQFAQGPRLLRYVGDDNVVQMMDWQASDITSDDIEIENENELTRTPAQREQMVKDFLQYGLFNEPDTKVPSPRMRSKILEMFNMGTFEDAFDIEDLFIKNAQRENMEAEKGKPPVVEPFDDHDLHTAEHIKYRLSTDYLKLKEQSPEVAQAFDMHIMEHQQKAYAKQMNAMAQAQQPMPTAI